MFTKSDLSFLKQAAKSEIRFHEKGLEIYEGNEVLANHCRDRIRIFNELVSKIELAKKEAPY